MSSAIVGRSNSLYSKNELNHILDLANFWLDMTDSNCYTTSTSTRINTLTDKSKSPKTLTRSGTISFDPIRKIIRPLGTAGTDFFTLSMPTPSAISGFSETIFVIAHLNNGSGSAILGGTNTGSRVFRISSTNASYGRIGSTLANSSTAIALGRIFLMTIVCYDGVPSFYYNGVFDGSTTITAPTVVETTQTILRGAGTSFPLRGGIGELIMFNTALNNRQRQQVEYYLLDKWKIDTTNAISTPLSIPGGCNLWLDGSDASTITFSGGTSVQQWNDKSTNGYNAIQNTLAKQPTYNSVTGGLKFSNAASTGFITTCPYSTTETIFVVVDLNTTIAGCVVGNTNSTRGRELRCGNGAGRVVNNNVVVFTTFNTAFTAADRHIFSSVNDSSGTYNYDLSVDNIQDTDSAFISFTAGSFTNTIGGTTSTLTAGFDATLYEVIIFNRALSYTDRLSVTKYLYNKWNINKYPVIPTTHTYYSVPPTMRLFVPTNIENCNLWLDGLDLTTITPGTLSTPVTQWNDKSGNGFNATAVGTGITPISTGGLTLTSNSYFTLPNTAISPTASGSVTFIIVFNPTVNSPGTLMSCGAATNIVISYDNSTGIVRSYITNSSTFVITDTITPISLNTTGIYVYKYTLGGLHDAFSNGIYDVTTTGNTRTIGTASSRIAARYDNTSIFSGNIYEVIIYNRALNTVEIRQIESYLADRWKILGTLPSGHPGKLYRPLNLPFDPRTLAACSLWLDASDLATIIPGTVGSTVTEWDDKSGRGLSALIGGYSLPTYNITPNGKPYINFGVNQSMFVANWSYNVTWNVFVAMDTNTLGGRWLISPYDTLYLVMMGINNNKIFPILGTQTDLAGEHIENTAAVNTNGTANNFWYRDGTLQASTGNVAQTLAATTLSLGIGANGRGSDPLVGSGSVFRIYEIIIYAGPTNTLLTNSQRQQVEGYLAHKWGLTGNLPSTHPFKKNPP